MLESGDRMLMGIWKIPNLIGSARREALRPLD